MILHQCTTNYNMFGCIAMARDKQTGYLGHFLPFYPYGRSKNQNFAKIKSIYRYYDFPLVYHKL